MVVRRNRIIRTMRNGCIKTGRLTQPSSLESRRDSKQFKQRRPVYTEHAKYWLCSSKSTSMYCTDYTVLQSARLVYAVGRDAAAAVSVSLSLSSYWGRQSWRHRTHSSAIDIMISMSTASDWQGHGWDQRQYRPMWPILSLAETLHDAVPACWDQRSTSSRLL